MPSAKTKEWCVWNSKSDIRCSYQVLWSLLRSWHQFTRKTPSPYSPLMLMPENIPATLKPRKVLGDGNCLFNTGSVCVVGNESWLSYYASLLLQSCSFNKIFMQIISGKKFKLIPYFLEYKTVDIFSLR